MNLIERLLTFGGTEAPEATPATPRRMVDFASRVLQGAPAEPEERGKRPNERDRGWQSKAWEYRRQVGEVHYCADFVGSCFSRLALTLGIRTRTGQVVPAFDDEGNPLDGGSGVIDDALEILAALQGPIGGQRMLQRQCGEGLFVAGEMFLIGQDVPAGGIGDGGSWELLSTSEIKVKGDKRAPRYERRAPGSMKADEVPADALVARIWKPDAEFPEQADSSIRGILDVAGELIWLDRLIKGTTRSRLAGSGVYWVANEIDYVPAANVQYPEGVDPFTFDMLRAFSAPLEDPDSASSAVPFVVRAASSFIKDGIRLDTFGKGLADFPAIELRKEAVQRLARGVSLPLEVVTGTGATNHWPVDEATEVFTRDHGWQRHDALDEGTVVLTLDHRSGGSKWAPLSGVRREHVEDREMVRVIGPNLDALTTLDHRWPVLRDGERVWTDSEHLHPTDRIIRAAPHWGLPTVAKYDDDFVSLVGWFVTEGTCTWPSERHCQVRIGQSHKRNPERVAELRVLLTRIFGPAHQGPMPNTKGHPPLWREDAEPRGMTLFHLNKAAYAPLLDVMESWHSKVIRRDFVLSLTQAQLGLLLEAAAVGDGVLRASGGLDINQRDPARLEPFALAAVLAGRSIGYREQHQRGGYSDGVQTHLRVPVTRKSVLVGPTQRERYTGIIFCPQVPVGKSFLARRNGRVYFTGNSSFQIDASLFRSHIEPLAEIMTDSFTGGFLWPMMDAAALERMVRITLPNGAEIEGELVVTYDSTELISYPNRSADADAAWDRIEISGNTYRKAKGFTEGDKPDEDEITERLRRIQVIKRGASDTPSDENPGEPEGTDQAAIRGHHLGALAMRVADAADPFVKRVIERVGARLVSACEGAKQRDGAQLRDAISGVPNREVAATLGPKRVTEMVNVDRLLASEFGPLVGTVRRFAEESGDADVDPVALATAVGDRCVELAKTRLFQPARPVLASDFLDVVAPEMVER